MQVNGVAVNESALCAVVAERVCGTLGHKIVSFTEGRLMCTQCGLTLDEIRCKPKAASA